MLKGSFISIKARKILLVFAMLAMLITMTACSTKKVDTLPFDETYATAGGNTVTKGQVWDELKWNASALFDEKAKEAILNEQLKEIETVMADKSNEKYTQYATRLKSYLYEDVYGFSYNNEKDGHKEEFEDLEEKAKNTAIQKYADATFLNDNIEGVTKPEDIAKALKDDTYDDLEGLSFLYENYYLDLAAELFARNKLDEEIKEKNEEDANDKDEDTVGYFTKTEIVSKYKSDYYAQGDVDVIMIRFASTTEAEDTLRAFGLKFNSNGDLFYIKNDKLGFTEYKEYYNNFDFNDPEESKNAIALSGAYGDAIVLELYVSMYNYMYTFRDNKIDTLDAAGALQKTIDQRKTTQNLINKYEEIADQGDDPYGKRLEDVKNKILGQETVKEYTHFTAEELTKNNADLYNYIYKDIDLSSIDNHYSTSAQTFGDYSYMVYKIDQEETANDKPYEKDITEDDLYEKLTGDAYNDLYNQIIEELTLEKLTSDYISSKITEEMDEVKVSIFDEAIEISYAKDHPDYSRTLSKAPDTNTVATFKYHDTTLYYTIIADDKCDEGLWEILEYRSGANEAIALLTNEQIKQSDEYKNIDQEKRDLFKNNIEYILASFANDGMASAGYPASLGKYNFLMLYYHTADINEIVENVYCVNYAASQILIDYTNEQLLNDIFLTYTDKAYNNYFSLTTQQVSVFLDADEDGEPDDNWQTKVIDAEKGTTLADEAANLIKDLNTLLAASGQDHKTELTELVTRYNNSSRYNPHEGEQGSGTEDGSYDPIGDEWLFSKYKALGLKIEVAEVVVDNTTTTVETAVKNKMKEIYESQNYRVNEFVPNEYLMDVQSKDDLVATSDNKLNYYLITGASSPLSSKYEAKDDKDKIYENISVIYNNEIIKIENIYNDSDNANLNQIKLYLYEYLSTESSKLLPTDVITALDTYLKPVITKFNDTATQNEITLSFLNNSFNINDKAAHEHFVTSREVNRRVSDGYIADEDKAYDNFAGWWDSIDKLYGQGGQN